MFISKPLFLILTIIFVFFGSLSPLYASQDPDELFDLEKMLRAMNSNFTTELTKDLLELESTKGLESEVRAFADEFTKNISNIMFGEGENPSLMPLKKTIQAQKRFDFLLNEKHPQLNSYSQNLHQILQDMKRSHQFVQDSLLGLIDGEIMGMVPSQLGFATDYIAPDSPIRLVSLMAIREVFTMFKQVQKLQLGFLQNIKYDHTKIEHILENFENNLEPSKFILKHYEKTLKEKETRSVTKEVSGGEIMTADQVFDEMLDREVMTQASLFNRHFMLMALENVDQSCRLFLPLLNVMLKDKRALQILKNQDTDTLNGIQKLLERYEKFRTQLDSHLKNFASDLKQQNIQKKLERLTLDQPKQEKIEPQIISTPTTTTKPLSAKQTEPRTQKSVHKPKRANVQNQRSVPHNEIRTNTNDSLQTEDHLTEWLFRLNASQAQTVSGKKEYRKPSEQELKEDRKQKAKLERKERAQPSLTSETPSKEEEMAQPKEDATTVTFILSGNYDIFESIMNETYKGEMGPVSALIKNRFNGMAYLTDGRWHFGLPHITSNQSTVFSTTMEPLPVEDDEKAGDEKPRSAITVHNPHKNHDKRLRPYHVTDIKKLFERGGYTLETVKEKKDIYKSESLQKTPINSNNRTDQL